MENCYKICTDSKTGESYRYPKGFTDKDFESALKYKATERDIFVCTYPKSGTTWLQNIVLLIFNDGIPFAESKKLRSLVPFLEFDGHDVAEGTDDAIHPHIMKTHLPFKLIPQHPKAKYIYVVRNPKDTCVSLYHHIKGFEKYYNFSGTFANYFDSFVNGNADVGDYFKITEEYYNARNHPNVLFLVYEDLKKNPRSEVLKVAEFIGGNYHEKLLRDSNFMENVLSHSSFEFMQKEGKKYTNAVRPKDTPFIRKGVVGDWKNLLTEEQSKRIDHKLKQFKIANLWDEIKHEKTSQFNRFNEA